MALFNKLFTNRKNTHNKHQDNVSEKLFAFSKEQVRVVLFRECDFRGRKLLFDSSSIEKVPIGAAKATDSCNNLSGEHFSEISNGFGYVYTKPQADFKQLAEMVFGSVAMSFRGTYFKIHQLDSPNRLMFTQVFSSPIHTNHRRSSLIRRSDPQNLEHSRFEDSETSSTSISENLSVQSTASDTVLVCRRHLHSAPLDVPSGMKEVYTSIPSLFGDSGYCAYSNPNNSTSTLSLSSGSLYKKWLRRTSTSLDHSGQSLHSSGSAIDAPPHHRSVKLGLTFILQLTSGNEEAMSHFFMEHVSLLEVMIWRARLSVALAYNKLANFASVMMEMWDISAQYLVNLLSGSYLSMNMWLSLSSGCDNLNSISAFSGSLSDKTMSMSALNIFDNKKDDFSRSLNGYSDFLPSGDALFSLSKFWKLDWDPFHFRKSLAGDQKAATAALFVKDFCELLETIDVKDTNFFMSTLVTAVLTHHLGWVNTCLPAVQSRGPFNSLWGELSDLFGALGYPTKMAQTIITGTNRKDLISKILVTMTYFIRCCDVEKRVPLRCDVHDENAAVERICRANIPKENYKKYEDHLREIRNLNIDFFNAAGKTPPKKATNLQKNKSCMGNLSKMADEPDHLTSCSSTSKLSDVLFVLGDDDHLVGIKKDKTRRPSFLDLPNDETGDFHDSDFAENRDQSVIKPSTSWTQLCEAEEKEPVDECGAYGSKFVRSQSVPPEQRQSVENPSQPNASKYRYSGVKFNLQQHPQILSNYMKSKNLEISHLHFGDKAFKFELASLSETIHAKYPEISGGYDHEEALQTPSNASELEFTSDLFVAPSVKEATRKMKVASLPMPKTQFKGASETVRYTSSLMRAASEVYMPDMVLQAPLVPKQLWESKLRSDLALASQHSVIDQPVEEAVAVIANTDNWEVQLMSSHTFIIDKGSLGIRVGMSQLVSNMLESLLQMWKLNVPAHFCLIHIEQTLQELCIRSKSLAEFLLTTEFCTMEQVTSTLQLEVNDVPLLLAVASTHSPQVTQKYGLSFQ